jgi:hypothetical protein
MCHQCFALNNQENIKQTAPPIPVILYLPTVVHNAAALDNGVMLPTTHE